MTEEQQGTPPDADEEDQLADAPDPAFDDVDDDDESPLDEEDDTDPEDDDSVDDDDELAEPPDGDEARVTPDAPES